MAGEIRRFAGEEAYAPPTVIHWGMVQPEALKPLYERGVRVLSGYFERVATGWDVNYLLDDDRSEYLSRHDASKDFRERHRLLQDRHRLQHGRRRTRSPPRWSRSRRDPNQAEIMDLFTHEQYFWPFYRNYIPDHPQRLDTALRWVTDHGYEPVFFHEGFLGIKD